jgi:hypothetical protein
MDRCSRSRGCFRSLPFLESVSESFSLLSLTLTAVSPGSATQDRLGLIRKSIFHQLPVCPIVISVTRNVVPIIQVFLSLGDRLFVHVHVERWVSRNRGVVLAPPLGVEAVQILSLRCILKISQCLGEHLRRCEVKLGLEEQGSY